MKILTRNHAELTLKVASHIEADAVIQGGYWDGHKGCFIGCLTHSSDPKPAQERFGLPEPLLRIAESIFERLPTDDAKGFFAELPKAVGRDGKDLSRVQWAFLAAELSALPNVPADIQAVIDPVIGGMETLASGGDWSKDAAYAARAADAAYAAHAAAAAARAAAAADAGHAAYSAAYAARDAYAADAAADAADAAYAAAYAARAAANAYAANAYAARAAANAAANAARAAANAANAADAANAAAYAAANAALAADFVYAADAAYATDAAALRQKNTLLRLISEAE